MLIFVVAAQKQGPLDRMSDPSACFPPWHPYAASTYFGLVQLDCPYGSTAFGEVTVPDGVTFGDFICIVYSLIPIFFGLALLLALCIRRGTTVRSDPPPLAAPPSAPS